MNEQKNKIAVVYLAWLPYGLQYFKDFTRSYLEQPAGHPHSLIIAFNGIAYDHPDKVAEYEQHIKAMQLPNVEFMHFQSGQDILIYKQVAESIQADYFLFLNTYSQFQESNWLAHYVKNLEPGIGLIGATGSYASYLSAITARTKYELSYKNPLSLKFNRIKYLIKIFILYRSHFRKFPAPHIRTNAFFISKKIFTSLKHEPLKTKMQAFFFENGRDSMTEQVRQLGYECIIVGKDANAYKIVQWPGSNIFWSSGQENLLVSDNQTKMYDKASGEEKVLYRKIAWGRKK